MTRSMAKRAVIVTGAAGYVAVRMLPALRDRYDLTLLDVATRDRDGAEVSGVIVADLTNPNRDTYRQHFRGADAVIHCAFVRARPGEDRFISESANVNLAF